MRFAGHIAGTLATTFAIGFVALERHSIASWTAPALAYLSPAKPSDLAACSSQYPSGKRPSYVHAGIDRRTTTICYPSFSIGYSGLTRTPLWAAERLTAAAVIAAKGGRPNEPFHPDEHLPGRDRAQLADYRPGYDLGLSRGHMAPSGDMPTYAAKVDSFTLANIVPQDRTMNGELWNDIEQATRQLARRRAAIYVVTGPIFEGAKVDTINGRVAIPTSLYKAVFVPGDGAAAYVSPNSANGNYRVTSIKQLAAMTGVDPFPGLDARTKARVIDLPRPRTRGHRRQHRSDRT